METSASGQTKPPAPCLGYKPFGKRVSSEASATGLAGCWYIPSCARRRRGALLILPSPTAALRSKAAPKGAAYETCLVIQAQSRPSHQARSVPHPAGLSDGEVERPKARSLWASVAGSLSNQFQPSLHSKEGPARGPPMPRSPDAKSSKTASSAMYLHRSWLRPPMSCSKAHKLGAWTPPVTVRPA